MIVKDEKVLTRFRQAPRCEWCGRPTPHGCDPHHVFAKGLGGGSRLDIAINLASLCRSCHQSHHSGHLPLREDLQAIVAQREGRFQVDIMADIYRLLRTRKGLSVERE